MCLFRRRTTDACNEFQMFITVHVHTVNFGSHPQFVLIVVCCTVLFEMKKFTQVASFRLALKSARGRWQRQHLSTQGPHRQDDFC